MEKRRTDTRRRAPNRRRDSFQISVDARDVGCRARSTTGARRRARECTSSSRCAAPKTRNASRRDRARPRARRRVGRPHVRMPLGEIFGDRQRIPDHDVAVVQAGHAAPTARTTQLAGLGTVPGQRDHAPPRTARPRASSRASRAATTTSSSCCRCRACTCVGLMLSGNRLAGIHDVARIERALDRAASGRPPRRARRRARRACARRCHARRCTCRPCAIARMLTRARRALRPCRARRRRRDRTARRGGSCRRRRGRRSARRGPSRRRRPCVSSTQSASREIGTHASVANACLPGASAIAA